LGTLAATTATATIENFGNGWFRCTANFPAFLITNISFNLVTSLAAARAEINTLATSLSIFGAQVEDGTFSTSYIPTAASQVTRSADVATMTSTNFSDWYNASEGTFALTCSNSSVSSSYIPVAFSNGTAVERMRILYSSGNQFIVVSNSVQEAALDAGTAVANVATTFCATYKTNNFALAINGSSTVTANTGTLPTVDRMDIGNYNGGNLISGIYRNFMYWPQRLIDAEVQSFSKG
jgi:hypothetical protein